MCGRGRAGTPQTLGTAKLEDLVWTLDDFKDIQPTWQLKVLVTPLLKSDEEPAMMILLRSYVLTTLELSFVTDSDATGSDERTV